MNNLSAQYRSFGRGANLATGRELLGHLGLFALTFFLYFIGSLAGFTLQLPGVLRSGQLSVIWPPNAVLLSILLVVSVQRWPKVIVAAAAAHCVAQTMRGTPVWQMAMQFGHNCILAVLAAGAIKRILGKEHFVFDTLRQTIVFLMVSAALVPAIAAILPAAILSQTDLSPSFWHVWRTIALSDAISIAILTPSLVALCLELVDHQPATSPRPWRWIEFTLLLGGLTLVGFIVFSSFAEHHLTRIPALVYSPVPLLLWAALRFGPIGASLSHLLVAVLCIRGALAASGPFAVGSLENDTEAIQYFLLALYLPNLFLAVVTRERHAAVFTLRQSEIQAHRQYVQLASIYRNAPIGLAFVDTKQAFRDVNEFLAQIHGLSAAEHVGRYVDEVLAPQVASVVTALCRRVIETGEADINREMAGPSGAHCNAQRNWLVSHYPVWDAGVIIGLSVILQDITDQKRAEAEIEHNQLALHASLDRIQDLAGRLIQVQEVERARIARELHDDVNQQLAALSMAISGLKRRTSIDTSVRNELEAVQQWAIDLTDEVRNLCHGLHSGVLQHAGLVPALRAYCNEQQAKHGVTISLEVDEKNLSQVSAAISLCLYWVVQEAITNVLRHARASQAQVQLAARDGGLELRVTDNGRGFDIAGPAARRGLGLISIEERIRMVHGHLQIDSQSQTGTTLRAWVPRE